MPDQTTTQNPAPTTPACPKCGAHNWETRKVEIWSYVTGFTLDADGYATEITGHAAGGADDPDTGLYGGDEWGVSCVDCGHAITAAMPLCPETVARMGVAVSPA